MLKQILQLTHRNLKPLNCKRRRGNVIGCEIITYPSIDDYFKIRPSARDKPQFFPNVWQSNSLTWKPDHKLHRCTILLPASSFSDSLKLFMFTKNYSTYIILTIRRRTKNPRFSFSSWRNIFTRAVYFTSYTLNNKKHSFPVASLVCRRCFTHTERQLRLNSCL